MEKQSTVAFHGNIRMTLSTDMFGRVTSKGNELIVLFVSRYTQSKDNQTVYASLLVWPTLLAQVTLGAPVTSQSTTVTLLGSSDGPLKWTSGGASSGIVIDVSSVKINSLASDWAWVFKLQNITPK